jgi:NADH dehydrogenase/NADH:ubiquinone oxidoreductase subunit G
MFETDPNRQLVEDYEQFTKLVEDCRDKCESLETQKQRDDLLRQLATVTATIPDLEARMRQLSAGGGASLFALRKETEALLARQNAVLKKILSDLHRLLSSQHDDPTEQTATILKQATDKAAETLAEGQKQLVGAVTEGKEAIRQAAADAAEKTEETASKVAAKVRGIGEPVDKPKTGETTPDDGLSHTLTKVENRLRVQGKAILDLRECAAPNGDESARGHSLQLLEKAWNKLQDQLETARSSSDDRLRHLVNELESGVSVLESKVALHATRFAGSACQRKPTARSIDQHSS